MVLRSSLVLFLSAIMVAAAATSGAAVGATECSSDIQELKTETDNLCKLYTAAEKTSFDNGPTEADAQDLMDCLQPIASSTTASNADRSIAYAELSALWGFIAQDFTKGTLAKETPGKNAWNDISLAVQLDPQNMDAWITYAKGIAKLRVKYKGLDKIVIQKALGVSFDKEKEYAIDGLKALPNRTPEADQALTQLNAS
jgi:hypothetical protein